MKRLSSGLCALHALTLTAFSPELAFAVATPATATHVYWTELAVPFGGIRLRRSDINGADAADLYVDARQNSGARDLALDQEAGDLYWMIYEGNWARVQRVNLGGGPSRDLYSTTNPQARIDGIAVDTVSDKLYWTEADFEANTFKIRRVNLDGTQIEDVRNTSGRAGGIELDLVHNKMYWVDEVSQFTWALRRANLDGSGHETLFSPIYLLSFVSDSPRSRLYFSSYPVDEISTASQNGGAMTPMFDGVQGVRGPIDLSIDSVGQKLFWINQYQSGTIQRSGLLGRAGPVTIVQGLSHPSAIAVGGLIPEPGTGLLALVGLVALAMVRAGAASRSCPPAGALQSPDAVTLRYSEGSGQILRSTSE